MMIAQTNSVTSTWSDGQTIDMLVEGRKIALLIIMNALFGIDAWNDLPTIWIPDSESHRIYLAGTVDFLEKDSEAWIL